jgi:hypothetical protein
MFDERISLFWRAWDRFFRCFEVVLDWLAFRAAMAQRYKRHGRPWSRWELTGSPVAAAGWRAVFVEYLDDSGCRYLAAPLAAWCEGKQVYEADDYRGGTVRMPYFRLGIVGLIARTDAGGLAPAEEQAHFSHYLAPGIEPDPTPPTPTRPSVSGLQPIFDLVPVPIPKPRRSEPSESN